MSPIVSTEDFAQLVRQHAAAVTDFAARLLTDRREAEEVAQDAFVKAFRRLPTFRGESSLLTWVQRIAYHEALDRLRRRRPCTVDISDPAVESECRSLASGDEAGLAAEREARIRLMEEAVDRLPPDDQLLLHLFYYEERPLREIAYIMDAEPNTLSQRLRRIRKRLMVMMKQKEDGQHE
ncbi:MAG: sigma-70 family RNA polymerase sigma factor [Prevotella sp.]|nr:sigma-70 family RNA polymerase sigma factor [Prevotella sp.]